MVQTPFHAPNCNAHAERFVRSIKEECLNRVIPMGERHFRRAMHEFVEHYHRERNHQGLDNELIDGDPSPEERSAGFAVVSVSAGCSTTITARRDGSVARLGPVLGHYAVTKRHSALCSVRISATKPTARPTACRHGHASGTLARALRARTRVLEPDALVASIRKELTANDRDIPIYGIRPMREYVSQR